MSRRVFIAAARSVLATLVAVGLCVGLAVPAHAAKGKAHKRKTVVCRPGGSHGRHWRPIVANSKAEVYESSSRIIYGCAYGVRPREIGPVPEAFGPSPEGPTGVSHVVLTGVIAAYLVQSSTRESSVTYEVEVFDLRTGRTLHDVPSGTLEPANPHVVGSGPVTAIAVKKDGAVAWIAEDSTGTFPTLSSFYEVHELDAAGESVLASGAGVAPTSLALAGSTIYWTDEGKPESASLE